MLTPLEVMRQLTEDHPGGFADDDRVSRAHNLASLKLRVLSPPINFPQSNHQKDLEEVQHMTKEESLTQS
ncbi:hypothetical protein WN944_005839 [Citrus x changshan-huyou]|uniref:Uncharacterized protein n=1 Tax=Citrus x changshan-huyou TaxID=2935761 RepID=A0AAP0QT72_9ROSI